MNSKLERLQHPTMEEANMFVGHQIELIFIWKHHVDKDLNIRKYFLYFLAFLSYLVKYGVQINVGDVLGKTRSVREEAVETN